MTKEASNHSPRFFAELGVSAASNGYSVFPIKPLSKKSSWKAWSQWCRRAPEQEDIDRWRDEYGHYSVALACGSGVVAIDIDEDDALRADALQAMATLFLGPTSLVRTGRAPRRVLLYRAEGATIRSIDVGAVQILADGRYVLAFGLHPGTKKAYAWANGLSPASVRAENVPAVTADRIASFARALELLGTTAEGGARVEVEVLRGESEEPDPLESPLHIRSYRPEGPCMINGRVTDRREVHLARLVYKAYCQDLSTPEKIASLAWSEFRATTDLHRGKRDGSKPWSYHDALIKADALVKKLATLKDLKAINQFRKRHRDTTLEHGYWTDTVKFEFSLRVLRAAAMRQISPSSLAVSESMLGLVGAYGICFVSAETLGGSLGVGFDAVKRARRQLQQKGFWLSHLEKGGKGYVACFAPNPAALNQTAARARFSVLTGATSATSIYRWEGGDDADFSDLVVHQ